MKHDIIRRLTGKLAAKPVSNTQETFFWHDYETFGTDPKRDRPVQFAGVRTDSDLNIIEDPVMIYCAPAEDTVPNPEACLVTGITPQDAKNEGVCEAEFAAAIHAELARPGTCTVGYNSIRFDDEVSRYLFYRNFYDPYAREWQNGCSRWDIIDMLRLTRALRPDGIVWPKYEDGTPSLRLEDLTKANGLSHEHAHDALSDVYATIAMAKLVKERQPKLYEYVLSIRNKKSVIGRLDVARMKPFLHISSKYASEHGNTAVVAPLCWHPVNRNAVAVWDLRFDPTPLLSEPAEVLRERLYTSRETLAEQGIAPLALKLVHVNKCPVVAPAGMLNSQEAARLDIDGDTCRRHLNLLRNEPGLQEKLAALYSDNDLPADKDPDHMLYSGGFFGDSDRALMEQVRKADASQLALLDLPFQDSRLEEMLIRYKARNYPEALSPEEHQQWQEFLHYRLLSEQAGREGYLTLPLFFERLNKLASREGITRQQTQLLEELALYGESIYPMD